MPAKDSQTPSKHRLTAREKRIAAMFEDRTRDVSQFFFFPPELTAHQKGEVNAILYIYFDKAPARVRPKSKRRVILIPMELMTESDYDFFKETRMQCRFHWKTQAKRWKLFYSKVKHYKETFGKRVIDMSMSDWLSDFSPANDILQ